MSVRGSLGWGLSGASGESPRTSSLALRTGRALSGVRVWVRVVHALSLSWAHGETQLRMQGPLASTYVGGTGVRNVRLTCATRSMSSHS